MDAAPLAAGLKVSSAKVEAREIRLALRDSVNNLDLTAVVTLDRDKPEFEIALSGSGPLSKTVTFPSGFASGKGAWLIVPLNEGILYPVDDETIAPRTLVAYGGHGICMPWYGVADAQSGAGFMAILGTPDDARIEITRQGGTELYIRPQWEASLGQFSYTRKMRFVFFARGGYVAQAKRYREYARETGLFKTLAAKRRENPNVDLLMGAVNIWNWDMDKVALTKEMKSLGMEHVLWSNGGSQREIEEINALGYLSSRYDIYQDVWAPDAPAGLKKAGWPDDLVWLPNGQWMKGWAHRQKNPDGTETVYEGGVINSQRGAGARAARHPGRSQNACVRGALHRHHHGIAVPRGLQSRASADPFAGPRVQNEAAGILLARQQAGDRDGNRNRSVRALRALLRRHAQPGALSPARRGPRHAAVQNADRRSF